MLTETGHYNPEWLHNQPNHVLRYEAKVEGLAGWNWQSRKWLLLSLKQCRPAQFEPDKHFRDRLSIGQHQT